MKLLDRPAPFTKEAEGDAEASSIDAELDEAVGSKIGGDGKVIVIMSRILLIILLVIILIIFITIIILVVRKNQAENFLHKVKSSNPVFEVHSRGVQQILWRDSKNTILRIGCSDRADVREVISAGANAREVRILDFEVLGE